MDIDIEEISIVGVIDGIVTDPCNPSAEAGIMVSVYTRNQFLELIFYEDKICSLVRYEDSQHVGNEYNFAGDYRKAILERINTEVANSTIETE